MSETVHYRGKAIEIAKGNEGSERKAQEILSNKGEDKKDYYDNCIEHLCEEYYDDYFYHPKTETLYEIFYQEHDPYDEIILARTTDTPGELEFELRYYNGGAGFNECLEEALDKLD